MKNISRKMTVVAVVALMSVSMANADDTLVDGYAVSSDGQVVVDSSGNCIRTGYEDSDRMLEECGYERVTKKASDVLTKDGGTQVTVVEATGVVKGGEMLAVEKLEINQMVLRNIEFAFDSAVLTGDYQAALSSASEFLKPHRETLRAGAGELLVIGHTDSRGGDSYNQKLSERRAQSVADYLIKLDPSRAAFTRVIGRGESQPIADNTTDEGRSMNRRVVLEVVPK